MTKRILFLLVMMPISSWAAFPTTGILDNFNRSNETPLAGGWSTTGYASGVIQLTLSSNQVAPSTTQYSSSNWATSFGPDMECYWTVAVEPTSGGTDSYQACYVRMQQLSSGSNTADGYECQYDNLSGTDSFAIYKVANMVFTQVGSTNNTEVAAGDKIGCEIIGSALKMYHYTGGAWNARVSTTDSTYSGTGYVILDTHSSASRIDDFGGGTVVPAVRARGFGIDQ